MKKTDIKNLMTMSLLNEPLFQSWQELDQRLCSVSFLSAQEDDFRPPPSHFRSSAAHFRPQPSSHRRPGQAEFRSPPPGPTADKRGPRRVDAEKRASSEYRYRSAAEYSLRGASEAKSVDLHRNGGREYELRGSRRKSSSGAAGGGQPTSSPTPTGRQWLLELVFLCVI